MTRKELEINLPKRSLSLTRVVTKMSRDWQIYVFLLPALAYFIIFHYLPMYGVQIAFRQYRFVDGITGSKWVGMKNFNDFMGAYYFGRLLSNTFLLNLYGLLWGFPIPIILAILLNQLDRARFKKFTQTAIYVPHFISTAVIAGMLYLFLSPSSGVVNYMIKALGGTPINFMIESSWFRSLYIITDVWQHAGWNTILYLAALTAIDPEIYEAATIDGANKRQKILYIDIPYLVPIMVMVFILNAGGLLSSNTDKALLMQTSGNMSTSDIIGVYVYTMGIKGGQFSYTAAIGLFVNIINFFMIISVNWVARRLGDTSLF
jgi:putative aldouronate transport system permease protein